MWDFEQIGNLATKIAMGPFGSNIKVSTFVPSGVPVISGTHLKGFYLTEEEFNYITEEHAQRLKNSIVFPGDVIFTHAGNVGQVAMIPYNCKFPYYMISQRQFYLRCNTSKLLPEFVTYYLHSYEGKGKLLANVSQTGVPSIAQPSTYLKQLTVPLPSILEQKKIVSILTSFDEKIELNTQINRNLEQQAQAIFKSWFVDFEPFQDVKFVDSELGPIPEGWALGTLKDMLEIRYGKDHKKLSNGTIPVYGSGGIMRFADTALYSGESVLIPRKGTLNNVLRVTGDFWTVDTMFYSIPKRKGAVKFSFHILSNMDLASMNSGSAVPSMTTDILNSINIIIPPQHILDTFEATTDALWRLYESNSQESNRLATLRDTLLPKLMSGEIDVSEVEV